MKRNKRERKKRKDEKQKKRKEAYWRKPIELQAEYVHYNDRKLYEDFMRVVSEEHDRIREMFWARWEGWYDNVQKHIRRGGMYKLTRASYDYFMDRSPVTLGNVLQKVFFERCPKYAAFNYSVEVFPGSKPMLFDIALDVLETKSTPGGTIHLLPHVLFPSNKPFGLTSHAIERMGERVVDVSGEPRPIGGALRCKIVLIPYKNQTMGIYLCGHRTPKCLFNNKQAPTFALIGYVSVEEHDDYFVGVTNLGIGFHQTPERNVPEAERGNYMLLTVLGGKVYRAVVVGEDTSADKNCIKSFNAVPYDLNHPHIHLLTGFEKLI